MSELRCNQLLDAVVTIPAIKIINNDISRVWSAIIAGKVIKTDNMWTLQDNSHWLGNIHKIYYRQCYDNIFEELTDKTIALIYGTPSIGKSVFLQVFLVHIVEKAKADATKTFPFITYSRLENDSSVTYHLRHNGAVILCLPNVKTPDYRLSDSVDLNIAESNTLTLEVASDNRKNYKNFEKRIQESTGRSLRHMMPLFSSDEQLRIHPENVSLVEAQFLFDIFGGSARNNRTEKQILLLQDAVVVGTMNWYFKYLDSKDSLKDAWNFAVDVLSRVVANADRISISSTMKHMTVENGKLKYIWASKFIEVLAGIIRTEQDNKMSLKLKSIFQATGMGNAFESFGHKKLTLSKSEYFIRPLMKRKRRKRNVDYEKVNFNLPIMLIRNISDVRELPVGHYGLPTFSNFPLVDAVIQPDTLIQFTVSPEKHKGAVDRLDDIRNQLSADRGQHSYSCYQQRLFQISRRFVKYHAICHV